VKQVFFGRFTVTSATDPLGALKDATGAVALVQKADGSTRFAEFGRLPALHFSAVAFVKGQQVCDHAQAQARALVRADDEDGHHGHEGHGRGHD
jgi:hypothetical protein